jgi:hypothetical protein
MIGGTSTVKTFALEAVPLLFDTVTGPLVALPGTIAVTEVVVDETTEAGRPLKET